MKHTVSIPEVQFPYRHSKSFDFEIVSNREILLDQLPTDHDPFWPHRLHFYAILFIRKGEGLHFIDFKKYPFQKGSIIFIAKEQVQAFDVKSNIEGFLILFTENFIWDTVVFSKSLNFSMLYNYHSNPPVLNPKDMPNENFFSIIKEIIFLINFLDHRKKILVRHILGVKYRRI